MTFDDFYKQGYQITATEIVQQTSVINLAKFYSGDSLSDCEEDVFETIPTDDPIVYDILDPKGDQLTPYTADNALTTEEDVYKFITNLPSNNN